MKFTIEKNVPVPSPRVTRGYWVKIAAAMELGDSVLVSKTKNHQTALAYALRRRGASVAQRQEGTGVRVWRTT